MRILNLSLDQSLLNRHSAAANRVQGLSSLVEHYLIVVPARFDTKLELADNLKVIGVGGRNKIQAVWRLWRQSQALLSDQTFDLITVQDVYFLAWVAERLAKQFKLPLEIQVHGFERFSGWRKILARYLLPKATGVRVVSQRLKKQLVEDFKVLADRISVIPIASDFQYDQTVTAIPANDSDFIFLCVARLVKVKNIAGLLRAFARLREIKPEARLWLVGDGPERRQLERLAVTLDLGEVIKFWGQRTDLSSFYKSAKAYVLFSWSEGWGLSVLEAGRAGLPVIMSDVGCAGEVVKDGQSGLVVAVGDEAALVAAMNSLLTDSTLRQNLAKGLSQELKALASQAESLEAYREAWAKLIFNQS